MRILITGAVEGLGRALAEEYLNAGHQVIALDQTREGLHQMSQSYVGQCEGRLIDLQDLAAVRLFAEERISEPYDVVILNAGISATGKFEDIPALAYEKLIAVNFRAPLILASTLVRQGKIARGGKIVFISSLSHRVGYPGAAVYAATKDGIAIYARSVHKAFRKKGVSILTVFPGPVRTAHAEKHAPLGSRAEKRMDPQKLAKIIIKTIRKRRTTLYPGVTAALGAFYGKYFPARATRSMRKAIYDKLPGSEF